MGEICSAYLKVRTDPRAEGVPTHYQGDEEHDLVAFEELERCYDNTVNLHLLDTNFECSWWYMVEE